MSETETNEGAAQAAWLAYRDNYCRTHHLSPRRAASQMRRREFIAGYLAATPPTSAGSEREGAAG